MSRRAAIVLVAVSAALLTALGVWWWPGRETAEAPAASGGAPAPAPALPGESQELLLYFPGASGRLYAEVLERPASETAEVRARAIVEGVLAGPTSPSLYAPFSNEVSLGNLYFAEVGEGSVAYLDLHGPEGESPPESGSTEELLRVYSLVNSLTLNVAGAERVVLLWNGNQLPTFAGHVDTSRPLTANRRLVGASSRGAPGR